MASVNDLRSSKFLTKEDCGNGILVTIKSVEKDNVAMDGDDPQYKYTLHFAQQGLKPMVLNMTNGQIIAQITGHAEDIEQHWLGWNLVLYHEPNISFGGKLVGGIRVRSPKPGSVQQPGNEPPARPEDKDLPF